MKCPKCGKEVELQTKKVGTSESGDPIYNEYAICRDCKKQWNLDKQRAKKAADSSKKDEPKAPVKEHTEKAAPVKEETPKAAPVKKEAPKAAPMKEEAPKVAPVKEPVKKAPVRKAEASERPVPKKPVKARPLEEERPVRAKKPTDPASRPMKKASETNEPKYSNIPPKKVRAKREEAVKSNYETMLSINPDLEEPSQKKVVPKFRILRILLGIISLAAFGFFCYKGLIAGLDDVTSGNLTSIGSIYIILATCMLVSGLLLLILQKKNSLVAFLIPTLFYLGSAVFAFFMKSKDIFFLYVAVIFAVMTIIMLILTFASRGNDDFEEDEDEDEDFDVDEFDDDEFDDEFDDDEFDDEFDEE